MINGIVAIAPQGGKYNFVLLTAISITAHATIAETASRRPSFSASKNRDNTPLKEPMTISNVALEVTKSE